MSRVGDVIAPQDNRLRLLARGFAEGEVDEIIAVRLWLQRRGLGLIPDAVDALYARGLITGREYIVRHGACLGCACTDELACAAGCYWIAENLCSECA